MPLHGQEAQGPGDETGRVSTHPGRSLPFRGREDGEGGRGRRDAREARGGGARREGQHRPDGGDVSGHGRETKARGGAADSGIRGFRARRADVRASVAGRPERQGCDRGQAGLAPRHRQVRRAAREAARERHDVRAHVSEQAGGQRAGRRGAHAPDAAALTTTGQRRRRRQRGRREHQQHHRRRRGEGFEARGASRDHAQQTSVARTPVFGRFLG